MSGLGPSFTVDTACSSTILALQLALDSVRAGQCDQAIVGGAHITLIPHTCLPFLHLGVLSPSGKCQSFDAKVYFCWNYYRYTVYTILGDGYVRSECIGCIFIQKKSKARRLYATVLHAKSNTDGYKEQGIYATQIIRNPPWRKTFTNIVRVVGITFPSAEQQLNLLKSTYKEAGIKPDEVTYTEAHGTGTTVGDPQECHAITGVFTKKRDEPLLIGSVKSNGGHAEPASGIMSLAKVNMIVQQRRSLIYPN